MEYSKGVKDACEEVKIDCEEANARNEGVKTGNGEANESCKNPKGLLWIMVTHSSRTF